MADSGTDISRGERIIAFRKKRNMSQDMLAEYMGISRQAMSGIENGGNFKVSNLLSMVSLLDVTVNQILYETAGNKDTLIDDIEAELVDMEEIELKRLLAGIRAIKAVS